MAKKKKDSDFKKIKLKVGRKVVKCANETDTSFKVRKIKLREAKVLKSDPISSLAVHDARSQIKLMKLRNVSEGALITSPERITGEVVHVLSKYCSDDEPQVRSEARKCVKQCFTSLEKAARSVAPIISVIMTHLKCGLTHLNPDIRSDARRLLSFIIEKITSDNVNQVAQVLQMLLKTRNKANVEDIELCYELINKFFVSAIRSHQEGPFEMRWSPENPYLPLNLIMQPKAALFYDCSLKNENHSGDIESEFLSSVRSISSAEVKRVHDERNWSLSLEEAKFLLLSLKIELSLGTKLSFSICPNVHVTQENGIISSHKTCTEINKISDELKWLFKNITKTK